MRISRPAVVIASLALAGMLTSPATAVPAAGAGPPGGASRQDGDGPDDTARQAGTGAGEATPRQAAADPGGAIRPVPGGVVRPFDAPRGPYAPGHRGVDLAAAPGDVVVAALPGTVTFSGDVAGTGWVTIDHGGSLRTTYGPLSGRVARGRAVARGQAIGQLTTGSHLDWGARDGDGYLDPLLLLQRWRLRLTAPDRVRG